jgi:hypothetical protein
MRSRGCSPYSKAARRDRRLQMPAFCKAMTRIVHDIDPVTQFWMLPLGYALVLAKSRADAVRVTPPIVMASAPALFVVALTIVLGVILLQPS